MTVNIVKELLGQPDLAWDVEDGKTASNLARNNSLGVGISVPRIHAEHLPLLNPLGDPANTNSRAPFDYLTAKNVDVAITELRKTAYAGFNFEGRGGRSGLGLTIAQARANTLVWQSIEAEAGATGAVIFFEGAIYQFAQLIAGAGLYASYILPWNSGPLAVVGAAKGTEFQVHADDGVAPLFHVAGTGESVVVSDVTFRNTPGLILTGAEIDFGISTGSHQSVTLLRCGTINKGPNFGNTGATTCTRLLVDSCNLEGPWRISGWTNVAVQKNALGSGAKASTLTVSSSGAAAATRTIKILSNYSTATVKTDIVMSGAVADGDFVVYDNSLSKGNIEVGEVSNTTIENNRLFKGTIRQNNGVTATFDHVIAGNEINNASTGDYVHGIHISTTKDMHEMRISGNKVANSVEGGIYIISTGATQDRWSITDNLLINSHTTPVAEGSIHYEGNDAASGMKDSFITRNKIIASSNLALPEWGIKVAGAGAAHSGNYCWLNYVKGYVTDVTSFPAGWIEPTIFVDAGYANGQMDGGAAV